MAPSRSRQVLHRIALVGCAALLGVGIALRDLEAMGFGIAILVGIFLLAFRKGLLGRIVLAVAFADTAGWMVPAAVSNVRHHEALAATALPVGLAAVAIAGILAAVGIGSRLLPLALALAAIVAVAGSQVTGSGELIRPPGDVVVSAKNVRFTPQRATIASGHLAVRLTNHDLFWHTFTVDALGVEVKVPVRATRRVAFEAPPGTYEFYCAIPGHKQAGMKGTLTVQ
jgi:plastocyanin